MKVLIVDDDFITLQILQSYLENEGYEVVSAENGKEALQLLDQNNFPLIITDWLMPEMDGLELVQSIRERKYNHYIYIILISGKSEKEEIIQGLDAGADDFITKPIDFDELRCRLGCSKRILNLEADLERKNHQLQESNRRMKRELDSAAKIQKTFLPQMAPKFGPVQFEWLFLPCDELAGDFLNIIPLDDTKVAMYILDVSGHGVSAALQSVTIARILSPTMDSLSILKETCTDYPYYKLVSPTIVARELNKRFPWNDKTRQFFTLVYGILDYKTLNFTYITAGHPPPILITPEGQKTLTKEPSGPPISFLENIPYEEYSIQLSPGDRLYFYSDGVLEAMDPKRNQFGKNQLTQFYIQNATQPLKKTLSGLVHQLKEWSAGEVMDDDVSLLALEISQESLN